MTERTTNKLAANIFMRAANYIREYGWQVEGMSSHGQPRCSMGALASAYPKQQWDSQLSEVMFSSLYNDAELKNMTFTQFNHTYKSGEKVAKMYERVAERLSSNA